jgi:hypothetical protein
MRLAVLVPSEEYRSYAGARIRYGRLAPCLAEHGIELSIDNIGQFNPGSDAPDVLLISKCHDAQSLIAASTMSAKGSLVGVDLFDDYFSQTSDARLSAYRNWLAQLVGICDFAVCSTGTMKDVVQGYRSELPAHVLNDPAPAFERDRLEALLARKLGAARDEGRIRLVWFGIGDNPYFPVGLTDLGTHGAVLRELARSGMAVDLKVLTNRRALDADGIAMIRQLPVRTDIEEWSEESEGRALESALLAFLPVSAQPFSTAKSLNRAFTALSSGCQVLSVGYPLYEPLEPLIYREVEAFLYDLDHISMKFSPEKLGAYEELTASLGSARNEADRFAAFLSGLRDDGPTGSLPISLVHGHSTKREVHQLVQAANGFSVASPYCTAPFNFDVIFRDSPLGLEMLISRNASRRLSTDAGEALKSDEQIRGMRYFRLGGGGKAIRAKRSNELRADTIPFQLATYARTMSEIEIRMRSAFGPCRTIVSETSTFPIPALAGD